MAPFKLFNTTRVCNTTAACASALDIAQERFDDANRLSYILGALLGIVFILLICSPLILNLPREQDDDFNTRRPPTPPQVDHGIEMRDFAVREIPEPEQFVIDSDEEETQDQNQASQSTLEDPRRFREVNVGDEKFHIYKSDASLPKETGVFHEAKAEQDLAERCARSPSTEEEGNDEASSRERIGTAV